MSALFLHRHPYVFLSALNLWMRCPQAYEAFTNALGAHNPLANFKDVAQKLSPMTLVPTFPSLLAHSHQSTNGSTFHLKKKKITPCPYPAPPPPARPCPLPPATKATSPCGCWSVSQLSFPLTLLKSAVFAHCPNMFSAHCLLHFVQSGLLSLSCY